MSKAPIVAIVDDDDAVREALCDLLQVEGMAAHPFATGEAFLAAGPSDAFDCIITDVRMGEIDGLELQRRLRRRGSGVPVIFLTSAVEESARASALSDGAIAWFTKPVTDEALLGALRAALGRDGPAR